MKEETKQFICRLWLCCAVVIITMLVVALAFILITKSAHAQTNIFEFKKYQCYTDLSQEIVQNSSYQIIREYDLKCRWGCDENNPLNCVVGRLPDCDFCNQPKIFEYRFYECIDGNSVEYIQNSSYITISEIQYRCQFGCSNNNTLVCDIGKIPYCTLCNKNSPQNDNFMWIYIIIGSWGGLACICYLINKLNHTFKSFAILIIIFTIIILALSQPFDTLRYTQQQIDIISFNILFMIMALSFWFMFSYFMRDK